jgi:hypothetical protein
MTIRERAREWIQDLSVGTSFRLSDLLSYLEDAASQDCDPLVLTSDGKEPQWKKDARWALQDCRCAIL